MRRALLLATITLLPALAGCPVWQSQDTPVEQFKVSDATTGNKYWVYTPSDYTPQHTWPLVISLHGTPGFDNAYDQIREWKALAEDQGIIVAAVPMRSVQGILPVIKSWWWKDLSRDEESILACLRYMKRRYAVSDVVLSGFSAGGYPMYYTGLRNPTVFDGLVARACNSDIDIFESIELTDSVRALPVIIVQPRDDFGMLTKQSWQAFRWLRYRDCTAEHHQIKGGHSRHPEAAWRLWTEYRQKAVATKKPSASAPGIIPLPAER